MLNLSAGKELIAELLRGKYTADLIEIICDTIGLGPKNDIDNASDSKRKYVLKRLMPLKERELKKVTNDLREHGYIDDNEYTNIICTIDGVENSKSISQIVFAASAKKPDINFDLFTNLLDVEERPEEYLVYKEEIPINKGLTYHELERWWNENYFGDLWCTLDDRLMADMSNSQKMFYISYYRTFKNKLEKNLPALLPETYVKYDNKTIKQRLGSKVTFQRMDFGLILPHNRKILIELDGKQHYSKQDINGNWVVDPEIYALERKLDRDMKFQGYEVIRVGNEELRQEGVDNVVKDLFEKMYTFYEVAK